MQQQDIQQLKSKGISEAQIEKQIQQFQTGFPFLKIEAPASIGKGIMAPTESEVAGYVKAWEDYKASGKKIVKFVPASGAASRMFKDIFSFVDADYDVPTTDFEKKYFAEIEKYVTEYCKLFGGNKKEILSSPFTIVTPDSKNPYKQLYVAN